MKGLNHQVPKIQGLKKWVYGKNSVPLYFEYACMAMFLKGSFFDNIIQEQRTFMDNMILLILSRFLLANNFHFFKQLVEKTKMHLFQI